jgi:hypothetical protein
MNVNVNVKVKVKMMKMMNSMKENLMEEGKVEKC